MKPALIGEYDANGVKRIPMLRPVIDCTATTQREVIRITVSNMSRDRTTDVKTEHAASKLGPQVTIEDKWNATTVMIPCTPSSRRKGGIGAMQLTLDISTVYRTETMFTSRHSEMRNMADIVIWYESINARDNLWWCFSVGAQTLGPIVMWNALLLKTTLWVSETTFPTYWFGDADKCETVWSKERSKLLNPILCQRAYLLPKTLKFIDINIF